MMAGDSSVLQRKWDAGQAGMALTWLPSELEEPSDDSGEEGNGKVDAPAEETPVGDEPVLKQPVAGGRNAHFVRNGLTCSITCQLI